MKLFLRIYPAIAAVLAACSDEGPAFTKCHQTGEFGNFGCARVEGVVRYAGSGNPLSGAVATLRPAEGVPNTFDTPFHETNASGTFSLEIHDFGGPGQPAPPPDPVPMYLHASLPTDDPSVTPPRESVLVQLKFAPVGEVPEAVQTDIFLNVLPNVPQSGPARDHALVQDAARDREAVAP